MIKTRVLVCSTATLLSLGVLVPSSPALVAAGAGANVITGTATIGGYKVGAGYSQAHRVFGLQTASTEGGSVCKARWGNGVTIVWHRRRGLSNWSRACVRFSGARVGKPSVAGKPAWQTNKGLRVGAKTAQLTVLYPAATSKRSGAYTVFTLQEGRKVSLQAWVKNETGRIGTFRLIAH